MCWKTSRLRQSDGKANNGSWVSGNSGKLETSANDREQQANEENDEDEFIKNLNIGPYEPTGQDRITNIKLLLMNSSFMFLAEH